jgi:hypothetical protein
MSQPNFMNAPWQKAAALKVIVGLGRKVGDVGCRNKKDLQTDFGPAAISRPPGIPLVVTCRPH